MAPTERAADATRVHASPARRPCPSAATLIPSLALALLAAALPSGCAYDKVADGRVLQWYSIEDDIEFGEDTLDRFLQALDQRNIPYDRDERLVGEIREIVERVAAVSHLPDLPWEAHLAELPEVNAWCAPGGKIVVYRGLFLRDKGLVSTRHELAAILAHEYAHATARHVTRARSRRNTLMVAAFPVWLGLAVFVPGGADAFGLVFNTSLNIYLPAYSREQEEEADALGMLYMAKAGYDPEAAVRVWKRASERERGGTSIYATHPDHAARAQALQALLPEARAAYEEAKSRFATGSTPAASAEDER